MELARSAAIARQQWEAERRLANNAVGIAPTRELVSADGMIQRGITTRVGPICRTVEDTARILEVYAGYDPKDELTAFRMNRCPRSPTPSTPSAARSGRIGAASASASSAST